MIQRAKQCFASQKWSDAIREWESVFTVDRSLKQNPNHMFEYGSALQLMSRTDDAIPVLEAVIGNANMIVSGGGNLSVATKLCLGSAHFNLAVINIGRYNTARKVDDLKRALSHYQSALPLIPSVNQPSCREAIHSSESSCVSSLFLS